MSIHYGYDQGWLSPVNGYDAKTFVFLIVISTSCKRV
jgi:hypothetical protein